MTRRALRILGIGACVCCCLETFGVAGAAADAEPRLMDRVSAVHRVCREARIDGPRELYSVEVAAKNWRFGRLERDDASAEPTFLPVDTRSNLRVLRGAVELFPSGFEPFGFVASAQRARELERVRRAGGRLRVGFFLGFDGTGGTLCLVRTGAGVTTVRMDMAFVELLASDGRVVAREDNERLRAWLDDREREVIAGDGPRGAAGPASAAMAIPESWQAAIVQANNGQLGQRVAECHRSGVRRQAYGHGQVVVRATVATATGEVSSTEVALSTIGDEAEARCVADAVGAVRFRPSPALFAPRVVLRIPVRLTL